LGDGPWLQKLIVGRFSYGRGQKRFTASSQEVFVDGLRKIANEKSGPGIRSEESWQKPDGGDMRTRGEVCQIRKANFYRKGPTYCEKIERQKKHQKKKKKKKKKKNSRRSARGGAPVEVAPKGVKTQRSLLKGDGRETQTGAEKKPG